MWCVQHIVTTAACSCSTADHLLSKQTAGHEIRGDAIAFRI